ncbi:hypothetical protein [Chitinophaga agri]|uniref:Lipoprotein n=1 Tax=Chitinophaga agri TaxID=2703787 RepID=A0A6B9ZH74_9BACT|nr:hypothetical protein [Chitinophaga agri]QHS61750.1 hypothetical protein GWR21_19740 [Chitinophaga agri]
MKYIITAFLGACLLSACGGQEPSTTAATADSTQTANPPILVIPMEARIMGTYKGDFGGSPIYITINYCSGVKLAGYDTHKGLRRNVSGTISREGDKYAIVLSEPGDHEFDGIFTIKLDTLLENATGSWKPSNTQSLSEKKFSLVHLSKDESTPGFFSGDHCDIDFSNDGNCTLNYYEKTNDSTFAAQMITLRGTWEKRGTDSVFVSWQPNDFYSQRSTVFAITNNTYKTGEYEYTTTSMEGDKFSFSQNEY